ncbi:MAG: DUF1549 domain-containing protein [Luteolibacter sp.]|uniref:DUF1549 domain-containing protein n=1 Tax=Luteolibacter sp. TaxID=1962973 RepID=UPI0032652078
MKPFTFLSAAVVTASAVFFAVPAEAKKKNGNAPKETPVAPDSTPASSKDPHFWTSSDGEKLEATFKTFENGIVTVEAKDGRKLRLPVARLSAEDQQFALECKRAQPRQPMPQDVIVKAAAKLDESINASLKQNGVAANPPASEAQLLRRLYLDTIGRIPTADEARAFLGDSAPDKRAKLINTLLNSPGYTMQMYNWLADMLRVKDDYGKGAKSYLYEDWLKGQIAMNVPWDVMVRDMITADGKLNENGAAGFLLRDAQMPLDGVSNLLTTFLGANVSCAQCHDHPFAEWSQRDFYSMAAFFGATDGFHEDVFRKTRRLAKSEELSQRGKAVVRQILTSNAYNLVDLPTNHLKFPVDYKYKDAKPGDPVAPELIRWIGTAKDNPSYGISLTKPSQLRNQFADWMVHPDNPRFATSMANRLWKKVFGIAVQEPVADIDDPSEASNPELLTQITTYMKQAKFDLREFQRILFNTAAYQRQTCTAPEDPKTFRFQGPILRRMSAEQAWDSIVTLVSGDAPDQLLLRRGDNLQQMAVDDNQINLATVNQMVEDMKTKGAGANKALAGGGSKKGGGNPQAMASAYEGGRPQIRSGLLLARASELQQPAPENHFLRLLGQSDRLVSDTNTTDGSVPQMLQLMNGPIQEMITSGSTALGTATKATTPADQIASLYLSFLARQPRPDESSRASAAMKNGLGLPDLAWVLLNSREFLFVP